MTNDRIRSLILDRFQIPAEWSDLPDDLSLVESYVLDSLDMLSLVALIESEFALSLPEEDIVLDNFGSIGRIAAYVDSRQIRS
jgi:acyl carrier protein